MNLYKFHSEPEALDHHKLTHDTVPDFFWNNSKEMSTIARNKFLKTKIQYITKSAKYSFLYARDILKSSFPEGEKAIAANAAFSLGYATIIRKPFPLGEKIIATKAYESYWYAKDVLKGPFKLGEPIIATDIKLAFDYAANVLKGPFKLGEPAIASDPNTSFKYAKEVLRGQFLEGEKAIKNSSSEQGYLKFLKSKKISIADW